MIETRLYVDEDGVVHLRYALSGNLSACGQLTPRFARRADDPPPTSWPTCMGCWVVAARGHAL